MLEMASLSLMLPVIGIIIGALLQYQFNRSLEGRKHMAVLRSQAYVDYFKAFASIAKHGANKENLTAAADAKVRICVYGSKDVVGKLSAFEEAGAIARTQDGEKAVLELLLAMRADTSAGGIVESSQLKNIIFSSTRRSANP